MQCIPGRKSPHEMPGNTFVERVSRFSKIRSDRAFRPKRLRTHPFRPLVSSPSLKMILLWKLVIPPRVPQLDRFRKTWRRTILCFTLACASAEGTSWIISQFRWNNQTNCWGDICLACEKFNDYLSTLRRKQIRCFIINARKTKKSLLFSLMF